MWTGVRDIVQNVAASSKVSNQPAIYGMVAAAEVERLRVAVPSALSTGERLAAVAAQAPCCTAFGSMTKVV
jgi:hypothetical protein